MSLFARINLFYLLFSAIHVQYYDINDCVLIEKSKLATTGTFYGRSIFSDYTLITVCVYLYRIYVLILAILLIQFSILPHPHLPAPLLEN